MSPAVVVALVAIAVAVDLARRVRVLLDVQRADREALRDAWEAEREAKRDLEMLRPGFEVSWGWPFEVFDRRDTAWQRKAVASCATREAADAVVRLMSAGGAQ